MTANHLLEFTIQFYVFVSYQTKLKGIDLVLSSNDMDANIYSHDYFSCFFLCRLMSIVARGAMSSGDSGGSYRAS
jgi:hypothetical protein